MGNNSAALNVCQRIRQAADILNAHRVADYSAVGAGWDIREVRCSTCGRIDTEEAALHQAEMLAEAGLLGAGVDKEADPDDRHR